MELNQYQKAVLQTYANGDFAYLIDDGPIDDDHIFRLGDTLLSFVLIELSDKEDCEDATTAIMRIQTAMSDLGTVLNNLSALETS